MSNIWKPRPPSFPSESAIKFPFNAADINEFEDTADLDIELNNNERNPSDASELDAMQRSKLYRARDSVFVRQKQRNSVVSNHFNTSDNESYNGSQSSKSVKFKGQSLIEGIDNEVFAADEEEVVLRRKTNSSDDWDTFGSDSEEELFDAKSEVEAKPWDIFKTLPPPDDDESLDGEWVEFFIKCLKIVAYIVTFVVILGSAVLSKSLILLMSSMTKTNQTVAICVEEQDTYSVEPRLEPDKHYTVIYDEYDTHRIAWLWCLFFAVIAPEIFVFGRSFRICYFKTYKVPNSFTFFTVLLFESLQSVGVALLVFLILPEMDAIKSSMMSNAVCLIPGILLLLKQNESNKVKHLDPNPTSDAKSRAERSAHLMTLVATICQVLALVVWPIHAYIEDNNCPQLWLIPLSLILISLSWWENFLNKSSNNVIVQSLLAVKKDLSESRYFTYSIVSLIKCVVTLGSMALIIHLRDGYLPDGSAAIERVFTNFSDGFTSDTMRVIRDKRTDEQTLIEGENNMQMTITDPLIPVWILLIQISVSYLCYAFAKFTCKIHIQTISFAIPVHLAVPITVSFIWFMIELSVEDNCKLVRFFHGFQYIFWYTRDNNAFDYYKYWNNYMLAVVWFVSLASQIAIAIHIWSATSARLASTEELFINPMYNSIVIDQSLALNRRRINIREEQMIADEENAKKDDDSGDNFYESVNDPSPVPDLTKQNERDQMTRIFVCATMWHENKEEMMQMLKAVMRLDEDQCTRRNAKLFFELSPTFTDYYEIEFNIFFDDAFDQGETYDDDDRVINRFVRTLIETMSEAASNVHGTIVKLKKPNLVPTPYGGKLEWTLPGQNKLIAHLKDKTLIRHRKRWSQCMYMYWLLGHRIAELPIDDNRKETIAMNTFILALDGDINFRPHALHLVVDLMKKNSRLGAACGRIHPIGSGPMVWYQKFEYAIGHWLQKATEHVFGCVLCSPGCFSLFRARAVMDDSVMNKYTTKPTEALHYVQYDQGEDRWLCTLLLQQGWRIEYSAASDSYTHAPEGFGEFYTQRRRWAPSTMANIMDLLGEYKRTVEVNRDISKPYILYQGMLMMGTILSPGTIFLMVVGAMTTVMNLNVEISLAINIFPILLFSILCLTLKKNDHIILAAMILSTMYALLMLAVLVATAIDISDEGILAPNSIFFIGLMGSFVVAAFLHPQEFACVFPLMLYMLLIPSMYLLLTIYSVTNMHVVSWGTREVKSKLTAKELKEQEERAREEAAKKQKSRFGFLDLSKYGSKSGIFTCMCCSSSRAEEEAANLIEIKDKLDKVYDNVDNIKINIDPKVVRRSSSVYRRKSFANREQNEERFSHIEEGEEDDDSASESTSLLQKQAFHNVSLETPEALANRPKWARDKELSRFPYAELNDNELQFWQDFIPKYLYPLDENRDEQNRILTELKDLRNKAVFAFGIINIVFVLFVYLLQMHKDVFGIRMVSKFTTNETARYVPEIDDYVHDKIPHYTIMDPIGLALIVFFGTILVVQLIGMFMHRFGTLAHLLAFTSIDFFDRQPTDLNEKFDENLNRNAVRLTKKIQKQGVSEMSEMDNKNAAKDQINRRMSVFARPQTAQPLNLNDAFRKRVMSMKPTDADVPGLQGLRRKSIGEALIKRRKTVDWGRVSSVQDSLQLEANSRTPSVSSFRPNERPKSIHFQEPSLHAPNSSRNSPKTPTRTLVNPAGSRPSITLTRAVSIDDKPVTGQHTFGHFNFLPNVADDMSANIIRNSLQEASQSPVTVTAPPTLSTFAPAAEQPAAEPSIPSEANQNKSNGGHSSGSDTNSSVSSNIDFNFDAYLDSDTSDTGFPVTTLQPTVVPMQDRSGGQVSDNTGEMSTYL